MQLEPLTVVTGFPRSGTSTMMRMLHLGGMDVLADEDKMSGTHQFDPYGDFELKGFEKKLKKWKPVYTAGKAVKIVAPYIQHCPLDRPVRIVFMLRDLTEIVASLLALRVVWEFAPDDAVRYAREFVEHHNLPVHYVKYADMMAYPLSTSTDMASWLYTSNLGVDHKAMHVDNMASAVDKTARYRERNELSDRLLTYDFNTALVDDKHQIRLDGGGSK